MKKNMQTLLSILLAVVILFSGYNHYAQSEDVLLASVDYVDYKFNELNNRINQLATTGGTTGGTTTTDPNVTLRVDNVEKQVGAIETNLDGMQGKIDFLDQVTRDLSDGSVWQVIELSAGLTIYASDTSEVVLRSGTAKAIGNKYDEGLSDITSGNDLKDGEYITKDHLLIIPRGDGRGVVAITTCFILYKGLYYTQ
ncbi:MAG: hypothetical protein KAG94_03720 [Clostridiales bacterium]|nr:hypothetical protein [Clostridiales bacterium]